MFTYKNHIPIEVEVERPDPIFHHELQEVLKQNQGFRQVVELMKSTFVIRNQHVSDTFAMIAAREMTNMEVIAKFSQLLQGMDASYVDCIDLNNPVFEWIEHVDTPVQIEPNMQSDVCAMVVHQQAIDMENKARYEELLTKTKDSKVQAIIMWLRTGKEMNLKQWDTLQKEITNPVIHKDFSEGALEEQSHVLDSGNYFDRPNPYFLNEK